MLHLKKIVIMFVVVFAFALPGIAGELSNFHDAMEDAYAPYRLSLAMTNNDKKDESLKAMNDFVQKWSALSQKYLENPPAPYNESSLWTDTFKKTDQIMKDGIAQVKAGQISDGHETIESIRDLLAKLRKSVSIKTFSDYINAYHTEMEHLVHTTYTKQNLEGEKLIKLRENVAVLKYLMNEVKGAAPGKYQENDQFNKLLEGNIKLLNALYAGLEQNNIQKVLMLLPNVKPAYAKLFIKFG